MDSFAVFPCLLVVVSNELEKEAAFAAATKTKRNGLRQQFSKDAEDEEKIATQTKKRKNGRWSPDEHKKFLEAIDLFKTYNQKTKDWKSVAEYVGSRYTTQCRTHAQKWWKKQQKKKKEQQTN